MHPISFKNKGKVKRLKKSFFPWMKRSKNHTHGVFYEMDTPILTFPLSGGRD
jgi:hypothetical protein